MPTLRKNVTATPVDKDGKATGLAQTFGPDYPGKIPGWAVEQLELLDVWTHHLTAGAAEGESPEEVPLSRINKEQLQTRAAELGLDTQGTKDELRHRIEETVAASAEGESPEA